MIEHITTPPKVRGKPQRPAPVPDDEVPLEPTEDLPPAEDSQPAASQAKLAYFVGAMPARQGRDNPEHDFGFTKAVAVRMSTPEDVLKISEIDPECAKAWLAGVRSIHGAH
jgi:hypothetical protein